MATQTKSGTPSTFDVILEALLSHPKYVLLLLMGVSAFWLAWSVLLWAVIVAVVIRAVRIPPWITLITGVILMLIATWDGSFSFTALHHLQALLWHQAFQGDFGILHSAWFWLVSLPLGLVWGSGLAFVSSWSVGIRGDIKRVAKGQGSRVKDSWMNPKAERFLKSITTSAMQEGSLLGVDPINQHPVILSDKDANLHTLAIGTTGSGKTTAIANIIESAVVRQHPLFYIDGKGDLELAYRVKAFAESQARPFYLFSMVGESLKYNPIAFGGFTSKKDRIIELREWSEDHYRKLAEGYLQSVFKILEKANLAVDLFTLSNYLEPEALYLLARELNDASIVAIIESIENKRKDMESLIAEIQNMAQSEIGHLFDCSQGDILTLEQVLKENGIAYFCLQPLAFPSYAETLGKLIINDLKSLIAAQLAKPDKQKIFTIFDEFSVFAGDQIINLINQGRGAGVHAVLATQSLSDILRKGDEALLGQILNNTNNYIIQRQNNPDDAETLSNIIGTKDAFQVTSQVSADNGSSRAGSVRATKEFIVHPDEIKRLGMGQGIFVNKQRFLVQKVLVRRGRV